MSIERYAVVNKSGLVANIILLDKDENPDWNPGEGYILVAVTDDAQIGGTYDGKNFTPVPIAEPSKDELIQNAEQEISSRKSVINASIATSQTKLLMGRTLSSEETAKLNAWLDYSDELDKVDPNAAPDITWPNIPS